MQFDDRLATVLRTRADSDAVLRTQFRQLLDLLGTARPGGDSDLEKQAFDRLGELSEKLPQEEQSRILREAGVRLRNPRLVAVLGEGDAKPAAAAMATARLTEDQWLDLIPNLPVTARGFLRHRRDLSPSVKDLLARLGVGDLVLPEPDGSIAPLQRPDAAAIAGDTSEESRAAQAQTASAEQSPPPRATVEAKEGIGALLRKIEAFRETRRAQPADPRLPLEDTADHAAPIDTIEFSCDADGIAVWANDQVAPLVVGLRLAAPRPGQLIRISHSSASALAAHQPLRSTPITIDAAPDVSGEWWIDAVPIFDPLTGSFTGYRGCLRRPVIEEIEDEPDTEADLMRQVLHELRTPVNAIQGFAEIIQQQLFGPAPHQYRAHAAAISVDAAKLLAGFDEVDRLVQLESDTMVLEPGNADLRAAVSETVQRLQGVLRPRNAGFSLNVSGDAFTTGLDRAEALSLCWRLLATAAGALGPGEDVDLVLTSDGSEIRLELEAPRAFVDNGTSDAQDNSRQRAINAGMFGPSFAFRLAQAEARSAGGYLICKHNRVTLVVPALTATNGDPSAEMGRVSG